MNAGIASMRGLQTVAAHLLSFYSSAVHGMRKDLMNAVKQNHQ